ncbi:MAG: AbrB family transcriptional regulator [Verrucomicrobia bacterium]|nr:AbrB family transcriptional regulator [Verrucomicrobiota bacterium]
MLTSTLTSKGQTTLPRRIREALGLHPRDRILYELADGKAVLRPLKGDVLGLRGSVRPRQRPEDFTEARRSVQRKVAQAAAKE